MKFLRRPECFNTDIACTSHVLHTPLFLCEQVLIIGGGDGGVLREVVKHPMVESVVQCEIDEVCITFPAS